MEEGKSSISQARTYEEIGEFWDTHCAANYWDQMEPVEFTVNLRSKVTYYAIDRTLSTKIREIARQRGISSETLLNLLVQEKLQELERNSAA